MSEVATQAKQARALLAAALSQLQGGSAAKELRSSAELVARSMGLLHQVEHGQSSQVTPDQVRAAIREALSSLQVTSESHPTTRRAIEAVAEALGIVHALGREGRGKGRSAQLGARPALAADTMSLLEPGAKIARPKKRAALAARPQLPSETLEFAPQGARPAQAASPAQAPARATDATRTAGTVDAAAWPVAQRRSSPARKPLVRRNIGPASFEASLGAHSGSNFYQGLGGSGVIDAGGIFVATHRIPPIGEAVTLHVHLPGGYQFQARGVVAWTRGTSATVSQGLDAPPGFGARFTEISPQGCELVNRYAANREPLFHDI